MKIRTIIAFLMSLIFNQNAWSFAVGDTIKYKLSTTKESYQYLTNYTSLTNGKVWYDEGFTLPLPFSVNIMNQNVDTFRAIEYIYMDEISSYQANNTQSDFYVDIDFDFSSIDRGNGTTTSQSEIRYKTEGTQGNRIFKLEWFNVGDDGEFFSSGTTNSYANFQLWLYEESNAIEFRFGEINYSDTAFVCGTPRLRFGIIKYRSEKEDSTISKEYYLIGSSYNPSLKYTEDFEPYCMDSLPPNGIVYRFTPEKSTSVKTTTESLAFYPNPATNLITLIGDEKTAVQLYDLTGTLLHTWQANELKDISEVNPGMYMLVQGKKRAKLIKQ